MANIHAALLLPQLNRLGEQFEAKGETCRTVSSSYDRSVGCIPALFKTFECPWRHLFPIRCQRVPRDEVIVALKEKHRER